MFIRIKTTPNSPRKSVQIVESVRLDDGKVKQRILRHIGIAENEFEIQKLQELAEYIKCHMEEERMPKLMQPEAIATRIIEEKKRKREKEQEMKENLVNVNALQEQQRSIFGIHEIYGKVYDEIGFQKVLKNPARNTHSTEILKDIVLARIANPRSKRGTVALLEKDFGIEYRLDSVYKMLDKIDETAEEKIQNIALLHTKKLLGEKIDVIFFDATTLYFESFSSDDLKNPGFSKDGKTKECQILLCLMVTKEGLPIGYKTFPGNMWEGDTLIPLLENIRQQYDLDKVVFVADSGLFCTKNLEKLEEKNFSYIVGARIRNMNRAVREQILNTKAYTPLSPSGEITGKRIFHSFGYHNAERTLLITRSEKRAQKDAYEREKQIHKLIQKAEHNGKIQDLISHVGYKKYVTIKNNESISINQEKITRDAAWDGIHGMITNDTKMSNEDLISYYHGLWQVEESFRISKHDLKTRPIFHWKPRRIKAHIAICFLAFVCVRNLEHRITLQYKKLSPEVIRNELLHVQGSLIVDTKTEKRYILPSKVGEHAKKIYKIMNHPLSTKCFALD